MADAPNTLTRAERRGYMTLDQMDLAKQALKAKKKTESPMVPDNSVKPTPVAVMGVRG